MRRSPLELESSDPHTARIEGAARARAPIPPTTPAAVEEGAPAERGELRFGAHRASNLSCGRCPTPSPPNQSRATVAFVVDGTEVEVPDDGSSLLDALRDHLGVRSAKDGCSPQGQCGCCTVLVDGAAAGLVRDPGAAGRRSR